MKHSIKHTKLILKNLRLLNDAADKGLHYTALDLGDKSLFLDTAQLLIYLKEQLLIETDYDESVGVWFLSDYGVECHQQGHWEALETNTVHSDDDLDDTETDHKFVLADSISISSAQFGIIGKYLWLIMFVVAVLVSVDAIYFSNENEALPIPQKNTDQMEADLRKVLETVFDSAKTIDKYKDYTE